MTFTDFLLGAGAMASVLVVSATVIEDANLAWFEFQDGIMSTLVKVGVTPADLGIQTDVAMEDMSYGDMVAAAAGGEISGQTTESGSWMPDLSSLGGALDDANEASGGAIQFIIDETKGAVAIVEGKIVDLTGSDTSE